MDDFTKPITGNPAVGKSWGEFRKEIFSPEEIAESDLRAALIVELSKARQEHGVSQKKLEQLSGVKQPIIKWLLTSRTSLQLETVFKILHPLGKTLAIVPLKKK